MTAPQPPYAIEAPAPAAPAGMKRGDYLKTSIVAAIVLYFTLDRAGGFALGLALMVFAVWTLYNLIRLAFKPAERHKRLVRLGIWVGVFVLASTVQSHWSNASRGDADAAAAAVLAHKGRTGAFPAALQEAGLDEQGLRGNWRLSYRLRDGKPEMSYPVTYMPMSAYEYDFDKRQWRINAY